MASVGNMEGGVTEYVGILFPGVISYRLLVFRSYLSWLTGSSYVVTTLGLYAGNT